MSKHKNIVRYLPYTAFMVSSKRWGGGKDDGNPYKKLKSHRFDYTIRTLKICGVMFVIALIVRGLMPTVDLYWIMLAWLVAMLAGLFRLKVLFGKSYVHSYFEDFQRDLNKFVSLWRRVDPEVFDDLFEHDWHETSFLAKIEAWVGRHLTNMAQQIKAKERYGFKADAAEEKHQFNLMFESAKMFHYTDRSKEWFFTEAGERATTLAVTV